MERACFIGRYSPPHNGHVALWKSVNKPLLILLRNTNYDEYDVEDRWIMIKNILRTENIKGIVMVIPDIEGIYYGRGVGYKINEIKLDNEVEGISATEIRKQIKNGDEEWKRKVPLAVIEYIGSRD